MPQETLGLIVILSDESGGCKRPSGSEPDLGQCSGEAGGQTARSREICLDFLFRNGLGKDLWLRIVGFAIGVTCLQISRENNNDSPF